MERIVGISEAKNRLAEMVGEAKHGGMTFILRKRNQPMAVLIGVDEFERMRAFLGRTDKSSRTKLSPELLRRQQSLMARARSLRERLGAPEDRLAEMFAHLPPEGDNFWSEIQELH
jgi:prevent-host-death family protein